MKKWLIYRAITVVMGVGGGLLATLATAGADSLSVDSLPEDRVQTRVTLYHTGPGLIDETRPISLFSGPLQLRLHGLGREVVGDSLQLSLRPEDAAKILSLSWPDGTRGGLLPDYLGQTIGWLHTNPVTGEDNLREGVLLSLENKEGPILSFGDQVEINPPGRPVLKKPLSAGTLSSTPIANLQGQRAGPVRMDLRYLSNGLNWRPVYTAHVNAKGDQMTLAGEAVVTNDSGQSLTNIRVRLVAGEVNRNDQNEGPIRTRAAPMMAEAATENVSAPQKAQEYWLFTPEENVNLIAGTATKLPLFTPSSLSVTTDYVFENTVSAYPASQQEESAQRQRPLWRMNFSNETGAPLPGGAVRVYGDTDEESLLLGEGILPATARGETVHLDLGRTFDLGVVRRRTDFRQISTPQEGFEFEVAYDLRFSNAKPVAVAVTVTELLPGDWNILKANSEPTRPDAGRAVWTLIIPAQGSKILSYRARVMP